MSITYVVGKSGDWDWRQGRGRGAGSRGRTRGPGLGDTGRAIRRLERSRRYVAASSTRSTAHRAALAALRLCARNLFNARHGAAAWTGGGDRRPGRGSEAGFRGQARGSRSCAVGSRVRPRTLSQMPASRIRSRTLPPDPVPCARSSPRSPPSRIAHSCTRSSTHGASARSRTSWRSLGTGDWDEDGVREAGAGTRGPGRGDTGERITELPRADWRHAAVSARGLL
jgi:hypothetical protein